MSFRFRKKDDAILLLRNPETGVVTAIRGNLGSMNSRQPHQRLHTMGDVYATLLVPTGPMKHSIELFERSVPTKRPKRVPMTPEQRKERRKYLREQKARDAQYDVWDRESHIGAGDGEE